MTCSNRDNNKKGKNIMSSKNCALIFVPHPDDELFVGNGMLYALAHAENWNVKLVIYTNGDYFADEATIRLCETLKSATVFGLKEEDVIFLGYGNRWSAVHIYNSDGKCISHAGKTETYAIEGHSDYSFSKCNKHHEYTRMNVISDMKTVIEDYMPELLVCVDFDTHPDHRALSLFFDEVIREVLIEEYNYRPLILKNLAYENVMLGKRDYYKMPHRETYSSSDNMVSTPILKWHERIQFQMPQECNTICLTKNPIYKAAKAHKSQGITKTMISAINADIIYWRVISENLALQAQIITSSGNGKYVNDMKTIDSNDINRLDCELDASVWIPDEEDSKKSLLLRWEKEISVSHIVWYENPSKNCNIYNLLIKINGVVFSYIKDVNHDGSANIILIERSNEIKEIEFVILSGDKKSGLSEVIVFDRVKPVEEFGLPCNLMQKESLVKKIGWKERVIALFDYFIFTGVKYTTVIYPNKYIIMKRFPICYNKRYLIPFFRIYDLGLMVVRNLKKIIRKVTI